MDCQAVSTNCVLRVGGCQFRGGCVKNACVILQQLNLLIKVVVQPKHQLVLIVILNVQPLENIQSKQLQTRQLVKVCIPFAAYSLYTIKEQCKKNTKEENIIWNTNADPATCADIQCATAPIASYSDHDGCRGYLAGCTVNVVDVNGTPTLQGCVAYNTCNSYTHEGQCKCSSDKDGKVANIVCGWNGTKNECQWDTEANNCRLKECKDFTGKTHAAYRATCIEGKVGPCLWITKYVNADSTLGACFSYESSQSLDWNSDRNCKLISSNCTTDGTECVGITSCAATIIKGCCKTGTNGQCIQTVSAKGAIETICKKFTSCADAFYLTHDECISAFASDYVTRCILAQHIPKTNVPETRMDHKKMLMEVLHQLIFAFGMILPNNASQQCSDQRILQNQNAPPD
ncbi:unnamed protein product [Paramecium octaurelia]|uniref:Uncharacterized protein n=1 Tax=Paramecium octaurelia TaxID=43137 RepID=A0A8S1YKP7_PAROT|nr:unnamed protein product [Paramecium octaurelia]